MGRISAETNSDVAKGIQLRGNLPMKRPVGTLDIVDPAVLYLILGLRGSTLSKLFQSSFFTSESFAAFSEALRENTNENDTKFDLACRKYCSSFWETRRKFL